MTALPDYVKCVFRSLDDILARIRIMAPTIIPAEAATKEGIPLTVTIALCKTQVRPTAITGH